LLFLYGFECYRVNGHCSGTDDTFKLQRSIENIYANRDHRKSWWEEAPKKNIALVHAFIYNFNSSSLGNVPVCKDRGVCAACDDYSAPLNLSPKTQKLSIGENMIPQTMNYESLKAFDTDSPVGIMIIKEKRSEQQDYYVGTTNAKIPRSTGFSKQNLMLWLRIFRPFAV
jgi:hypothetical protein